MVLSTVMAAEGVAFAALAGLDGSPAWRVARVLVVVAVTVLALWLTRRAGRVGRGSAALLLLFVLLPLTVAVNMTNRPAGPLGSATPAAYGFAYQDVSRP